MSIDIDLEKIKKHVPGIMDFDQLRKSAVAIPLIETERGMEILFQERSHHIDRQPGDICFPGGMIEAGETPEEAALREICEELLISPHQVELIGACDILLTGKGAAIYPFVVRLYDYENTFSRDEVESVFTVPVTYFRDTEPEEVFVTTKDFPDEDFPFHRVFGGRDYPWGQLKRRIIFYQYEDKNIWGLTGRMIESFTKLFLK